MSNAVNGKEEIVKERIRVNTDKLKEKSDEWAKVAKEAERELRSAGTTMENIQAGFWAEPVISIQKAFEQLIEKGCRHMVELCDHMEKLSDIAEGYEEAEKENELVIKDNRDAL